MSWNEARRQHHQTPRSFKNTQLFNFQHFTAWAPKCEQGQLKTSHFYSESRSSVPAYTSHPHLHHCQPTLLLLTCRSPPAAGGLFACVLVTSGFSPVRRVGLWERLILHPPCCFLQHQPKCWNMKRSIMGSEPWLGDSRNESFVDQWCQWGCPLTLLD